jgi:hypothetical protein
MLDLLKEANDPGLRAALDEITSKVTAEDVGRQVQLVRSLAARYSHSITLVVEAVPSNPATFQYTCFQHAFELVDPPRAIKEIAMLYPTVYPSAEFVEYLIAHYLREVTAHNARDADVVVYSSDVAIRHAGKVRGDLILSKWGTAHLWSHRLFEVPASYGSIVRLFSHLSHDESAVAFVEFAESKLGFKLA